MFQRRCPLFALPIALGLVPAATAQERPANVEPDEKTELAEFLDDARHSASRRCMT
jgi:hypothetical protein